jgi:glyoxylase-like metal-dependent hydrolase (beta-lactamase superfamily II)
LPLTLHLRIVCEFCGPDCEANVATPSLRIGNVEIVPLLDGTLELPPRAVFPAVPAEQWHPPVEQLNADGSRLVLSISSFLIRSQGKTILVDTGIGAKNRGRVPNGRLPEAIAEAGVRLDEIDIVMATHMHIDHVGWHTTRSGDAFVPTFPKATHVFNRDEWAYWTAPDVAHAPGSEHIVDCVLPLEGVVEIKLVDSEHALTPELTLLPTPGHTIAHSSVAIVSGGEAAVIIGDVCHHPMQITEGWSPVFDMNPVLSHESRERLLQRIEDDRMTVIAGHFAHPGFGRLVRIEGKRYFRAL